MTQKLREQISALVDQALPEGEHELLLRRFAVEKSLRLHWERYHLIGEAIRKGLPAMDTRGLADRVMAAITEQPQPVREPEKLTGVWRGFAGVAVAATVAVVAITGLRYDARRAGLAPSEVVPTGTVLTSQPLPASTDLMNSDWSGNGQAAPAELRSTLMDQEDFKLSQALGGKQAYYQLPRQDVGAADGGNDKPADSGKKPPRKRNPPR